MFPVPPLIFGNLWLYFWISHWAQYFSWILTHIRNNEIRCLHFDCWFEWTAWNIFTVHHQSPLFLTTSRMIWFCLHIFIFRLLGASGPDEMLSVGLKCDSWTTWRHNMWTPNVPDKLKFKLWCQPHIRLYLAHCWGTLKTNAPANRQLTHHVSVSNAQS